MTDASNRLQSIKRGNRENNMETVAGHWVKNGVIHGNTEAMERRITWADKGCLRSGADRNHRGTGCRHRRNNKVKDNLLQFCLTR